MELGAKYHDRKFAITKAVPARHGASSNAVFGGGFFLFPPMSIRMMHQFKRIQTTSSAKFVGLMLADHLNDATGRCDPSVALLCVETCLEERAVRRALKALRDGGHITQICRPGCTPIYRLHPQFPAGTTLPQIDTPPHIDTPVELSPLPIETGGSPPNRQGTPPHIDRVPLPISPPKSERTRREPEKNPFASAAANAGDGDSLFPIGPPPPPKREPKPKPEGTADPRLKPIKDGLAPAFEKTKGREFDCDWKKTVGAIRRFLESRSKVTPDEFLEVWSLVCKYSSSPFYPKITDALDVAYLCRNYETVTGHIERAYHSESQTKR